MASEPSRDRHTYIPPQVEQAMNQQAQRALPPHLQQYRDNNLPMPAHVERAMADHLQQSVPPHMRRYVEPYMQQHVANVGHTPVTPPGGGSTPAFTPQPHQTYGAHPGQTYRPVSGGQPPSGYQAVYSPAAQAGPVRPAMPAAPQPIPPSTPLPPAPQTSHPAGSNYDFIMNPESPKKAGFKLPTLPGTAGNPLLGRAIIFGGGAIVLLIVLNIIRGLIFPGTDYQPFISVMQDQQQLIHLATNADQKNALSPSNRNFSATIRLALASSQTKTIEYLQANDVKVGQKQLNLKIRTQLDQQLEDAAAATTYNETYKQVMEDQVKAYADSLGSAYKLAPGQKGRELLEDSYAQAQLLYLQLSSATATP